jgi:hypothetical protein
MAAALVTDPAARLYEVCGNDMRIFHDLCRGCIEPIGILFSEFAGSPMPPAVIMQVLSITEAQLLQAQTLQAPPTASLAQFEEAMAAALDDAEDVQRCSELLQKHIGRLQHAASVLDAVTPQLAQFHAQAAASPGGSIAAIERLLMDLAPPGQKGRPMPPGMIKSLQHAIARVVFPRASDQLNLCTWKHDREKNDHHLPAHFPQSALRVRIHFKSILHCVNILQTLKFFLQV